VVKFKGLAVVGFGAQEAQGQWLDYPTGEQLIEFVVKLPSDFKHSFSPFQHFTICRCAASNGPGGFTVSCF